MVGSQAESPSNVKRDLFTVGAVAAALACSSLSAMAAPPRPVTIDDEMKLRSIVDVRISPDGQRVAYVVSTPSLAKNEHEVALYVVPAGGGAPVRLGETVRILNTPLPAPRLRWSPDSSTVGVLGLVNDKPQVFAIPVRGAAPRALTDAPEGVSLFEWSPDGKSLAYLSRDTMSAEEARQRQDKSFVIHVDAPERPGRVFARLSGLPARPLTPPSHYVDSFTWSPDGREIAYSAAPRTGFAAQYETRLYAVPTAGGAPRTILDRTGMNARPRWSPDGRLIAFISTNGRVDIMAARSLTVIPAASGAPRIYPMDDAWVNEFAWARDSSSIYFQANDGTFASREHMFEQPIARLWVDDGRAERVVPGASVDFSISLSADGSRLAYRAVEGRTMGDVFVLDTASGRATKLTNVNPELADLALGKLESVKWRSLDGMEIWGLLLTPPGWTAGKRLPMIVYCHGGPGGGVTYGLFPQFMHTVSQVDPYPTEALASAGFAVLFPMPRGGAGYGEAGQRAIVNSWGEADYQDIMAGVDEMIRRGIADPDRLGVLGASYGGYMTNWIVTQTGRFKAASASASICDLTDPFFLSDGGEFMAHYFRKPWENPASYVAHSPLKFADRVTTPLLIQHGERDPRVPIAGAWKFYRTLKALGKTVEFDIYPGGGHVLYAPMLQRESMRRNLEWFKRWIETGPARISRLPADARRASDVRVGRQLVQHEARYVRAGDAHRPEEAPDVPAMAIATSLLAVGQHAGSNDHPLHVAPRDQAFLPRLVPEIEGQNHGNREERVVQAHTPGAVSDAERSLADEPRDSVNLHGAQDVPGSLRQDASWREVPLVAEGGKHRLLAAHRPLDGTRVEHVAMDDGQVRMRGL
jgi:dipeptidyl aminopeptidase/acylaminoacyl peptidase